MYGRIREYVSEYNKIPRSLTELPKRQGKDNEIKDAWGRQLHYAYEEGVFTLMSYGKDGISGGSGEDADIVTRFTLEDDVFPIPQIIQPSGWEEQQDKMLKMKHIRWWILNLCMFLFFICWLIGGILYFKNTEAILKNKIIFSCILLVSILSILGVIIALLLPSITSHQIKR